MSSNERSGASSSEGGGKFEYRASTYLLTYFFLEGVGGCLLSIKSEWRKYLLMCPSTQSLYFYFFLTAYRNRVVRVISNNLCLEPRAVKVKVKVKRRSKTYVP